MGTHGRIDGVAIGSHKQIKLLGKVGEARNLGQLVWPENCTRP
jgi:hypothetical protein